MDLTLHTNQEHALSSQCVAHWIQLYYKGQRDTHTCRVPKLATPFSVPCAYTQSSVCARWYIDRVDHDGVVAQELIACGLNGILCDITGKQVAHLDGLATLSARIETCDDEQVLMDDIVRKTKSAQCNLVSFSAHLDRVRQVPILLATLSAECVEAGTVEFFEHAMMLGDYLACSAPDRLAGSTGVSAPGLSAPDRLANMLTVVCHAWHYRRDLTLKGEVIDFWSSLWSYPNAEYAAFDCEDGTKALMELFIAFKRLDVVMASVSLKKLHKTASLYTPWLTIGTLGDKKALHCYLLLMDSRLDDGTFSIEIVRPTIVLDSTINASGAWTSLHSMQAEAPRDLARAQKERDVFVASGHAMSTLTTHIRPSIAYAQHLYGPIQSCITSSALKGTLCQQYRFDKACDVFEFFTNPGTLLEQTLVLEMSTQTAKSQLARCLAYMPCSVLPRAPHQSDLRFVRRPGEIVTVLTHRSSQSDRVVYVSDKMAFFVASDF